MVYQKKNLCILLVILASNVTTVSALNRNPRQAKEARRSRGLQPLRAEPVPAERKHRGHPFGKVLLRDGLLANTFIRGPLPGETRIVLEPACELQPPARLYGNPFQVPQELRRPPEQRLHIERRNPLPEQGRCYLVQDGLPLPFGQPDCNRKD